MKRLYSLFEKQNNHWVRISPMAFTHVVAVKRFQDAMIAPFLLGIETKGVWELKPIRAKKKS